MGNSVVQVNTWSLEIFGRPGSAGMNTSKKHLKKIRVVAKAIKELSLIQIPDLGDFTDGEPA